MASVESQGQGLEIGGLRQCRVDRVIGVGAGYPQDAAGAAGIGEAAAHRFGELRRIDMERAGSDEEDAAARARERLAKIYRHLPAPLRFVGPYQEANARLRNHRVNLITLTSNRFWTGQPRMMFAESNSQPKSET